MVFLVDCRNNQNS